MTAIPDVYAEVSAEEVEAALSNAAYLREMREHIDLHGKPIEPEHLHVSRLLGQWLINSGVFTPVPNGSGVDARQAVWRYMQNDLDWDTLLDARDAAVTWPHAALLLRAGLTWPEVRDDVAAGDPSATWDALAALRGSTIHLSTTN